MSKILLADCSANFPMDNEHEKSRVKEATNEVAILVSVLNLGSVEELPIGEFVQLAREEIVGAKYSMVELVYLTRVREIHLGLDLNAKPMEEVNVDDQPKPIVKLPQALECTQLLSNFAMEHP